MCVFTRGSGSTKCRERWGGITNVMCVCLLEGLSPPSVGRDGVVLLMLCVCVY